MSAPTMNNNMNANIGISSAALDGHLSNIRSSIPPSIRSLCIPDSISTFLRNILLAMIVLNSFLLLSSPFASGARFMGSTIMLISAVSCAHVAILVLVFGGNHGLADTASSSLGLVRLANTLRGTSAQYGANVFAYGSVFGSTVVMALLMHVISSYYGGVSQCITRTAEATIHSSSGGHTNLTGGYGNNHHNGSSASMDTFTACGASGPAGFVSFLSGLLFWFNAVLAAALYVRREELLSGEVGGMNSQYDEIGTSPEGFAGDFPPTSANQQGMRTMQV